MADATSKTCNKCARNLPLDQFSRSKDNRDRLRHECRKCASRIASENARRRRQRTPEPTDFPESKTCRRCAKSRPPESFYVDRLSRDGLTSWCRECAKESAKISARRNRDSEKPVVVSKTCTGCRESKRADQFYPRPTSADGLTARCSDCLRADRRDWTRNNPEKVAEYRRIYDALHHDEKLERLRQWRTQNVEYRREYSRRYDVQNAERVAQWKRDWYSANKERLRERTNSDPDLLARRREIARAYRIRHGDRVTERQRLRRVDNLGLTIAEVDLDALWTGVCGICDRPLDHSIAYPDPFSKSIDHIVPLALGGTHESHNLQWAHLFCNLSKGATVPESGLSAKEGGFL